MKRHPSGMGLVRAFGDVGQIIALHHQSSSVRVWYPEYDTAAWHAEYDVEPLDALAREMLATEDSGLGMNSEKGD